MAQQEGATSTSPATDDADPLAGGPIAADSDGTPTAPEEPSPGRRRGLLDRLEVLIIPAVLLVVWQVSAVLLGDVAMATPVATISSLIDGFTTGWLTPSLVVTLRTTAMAFVVAAVLGLWAGFALGLGKFWGKVMEGPLLWIYSIPKVTLFPVFLLFLGLGTRSQIAFGAFHGFFPLVLFVLNGIRSMSPVYLKIGRVYGLGRWQVFSRIIVPDILPAMVTGLRYCFSLTFLGVILGEMFASREGAGHLLVQAIGLQRLERIFAIALALVIFAFAVTAVFVRIERRIASGYGHTSKASP